MLNVARVLWILLAVARVLGDFSPRKFPSFVALAVKGFTVCFVLKRTLLPQSSFIARREIPLNSARLIVNNLVLSQRFFDFSSSLGLSAAFGSDVRLRSARKISNLYLTNIHATERQFN